MRSDLSASRMQMRVDVDSYMRNVNVQYIAL